MDKSKRGGYPIYLTYDITVLHDRFNNLRKSPFIIIGGDPARTNDGFGITGVTFDNRYIDISLTTQFTNTRYGVVAEYIQMVKKKMNPDMMLMEKNGLGKGVDHLFRTKYKLPIIPVNNTGATIHDLRIGTMEKTATVDWLVIMFRNRYVRFPKEMSISMNKLFEQIKSISSYITPSGNTSYKAIRGRHDDLFMSFLLCAHAARVIQYEFEALNLT